MLRNLELGCQYRFSRAHLHGPEVSDATFTAEAPPLEAKFMNQYMDDSITSFLDDWVSSPDLAKIPEFRSERRAKLP